MYSHGKFISLRLARVHVLQKSNTATRSYLDFGCKGEHGEGCKTATFVRTYNKWMGKNFRRGKIFVGEKYSSRKNFVGEKCCQLSKISSIFHDELFPDKVYAHIHMHTRARTHTHALTFKVSL